MVDLFPLTVLCKAKAKKILGVFMTPVSLRTSMENLATLAG
jgi:hypothetical protein